MKKKYFLRGLGAGIMMSAIILSITSPGKELSNEEIKKRAMKLGMIEKESALDQVLKPTEEAIVVITDTPKATKEPAATESVTEEPVVTESVTKEPKVTKIPVTETPEITREPKITTTPDTTEKKRYITVQISAGMWSEEIAKKFEELKLVKNAEDFDDFLCDNGYASKIKVGQYKMPYGATYKEIAEIITK